MNVFRETLRRVAENVPGARAVSVLGFDGIPIDTLLLAQDVSIEEVAAELGGFVRKVEGPRAQTGWGQVGEIAVVSGDSTAVLSRVTAEYYLLLLLSEEGNLGRARWELKKAGANLEKELL